MIAATSSITRNLIVWSIAITTSLLPMQNLADETSDAGKEAQQFAETLRKSMENSNTGPATNIDLQKLYPDIGKEVSIEELQAMFDSPDSMSTAGNAMHEELSSQLHDLNPSISAQTYEIVRDAKNLKQTTTHLEDSKWLDKSKTAISEGGMQNFLTEFSDCTTEESFRNTQFTTHIPDLEHCHRLYKPKGNCTIHHTIEVSVPPTDIVFLVDNSDSMDRVIAELRNNVKKFAKLLTKDTFKNDLQLGGAAFREQDYTWNKTPLTIGAQAFENWISSVNTESASTAPFDVISWAANNFVWRDNVRKIIVLIGNDDAGGDKQRAQQSLLEKNIQLYIFHDNSETKSIGEHIADHFTGEKLIKFAQLLTLVRDEWTPKDCTDDALATTEEFCHGSYTATPAADAWSATISGFEVTKDDPIYQKMKEPPLPNVSKLTTRVDVSEIKCNYNHGVGSCWIDPQGEKQQLKNDQDIDGCTPLRDRGCILLSSACVDGAIGSRGKCYVYKDTYDCGEDIAVPSLEKVVRYNCGGPIRCMGEDCVGIPREQSLDFARAAGMLQVAEHMAQDIDKETRTVFEGGGGTCKIAVGGVQDCCQKPEGVSLNDYLRLVFAIPKFDEAISFLTKETIMDKSYKNLTLPFHSAWEQIKQPFTTPFESFSSFTKPITEPFCKIYDATIGAFKNKLKQLAGQGVAQTATANIGAQATGNVATSTTATAASSVLGGILSAAMTAYTLYSVSILLIKTIWKCERHELEMNAKRALKSCHYVGSYCETKFLGFCVESRETYCCFNSPLSRILQEAVRKQLGLTFGSAKKPNCSGIPIETLQKVDWKKIDLDEWLALMQKNKQLPTMDKMTLDGITGSGSWLNADGNRKNAVERAQERIKNIDVDAIRKKASKELAAAAKPTN